MTLVSLPLWAEGAAPAGEPESTYVPASVPDSVDVVIVGAGYTGLWSAYHLLGLNPSLEVVVLEARHIGFGASGRNGGWVSALYPVSGSALAARHGASAARSMLGALQDTVLDIGAVVEQEHIDCGFIRGGTLGLARSTAQALRAQAAVTADQPWGRDTIWLNAAEARARLDATHVHGATFSPHCARVHPRRLVDGLARAVRARGGLIIEGTPVQDVGTGVVQLSDGRTVRTRHTLRAVEAWTARFTNLHRRVAPVYSLMVATEPLPDAVWESIGLQDYETFTDHRHVVVYGQRTEDGRIAFGGRGAPYHWRSAIDPRFDEDSRVFQLLRAALREMLPQIGDATYTHAWGGPLGIHRDWNPGVGYDTATRIGWAGGYVGDGVAASALAGRTLAELVLGDNTIRTRLPWVGHQPPAWEMEPLRWIGVNAGLRVAALADREESLTRRPASLGRLLSRLTSH